MRRLSLSLVGRRHQFQVPYWADGVSIGNRPVTADWQENSDVTPAVRRDNAGHLWAISDSPANKLLAIRMSDGAGRGVWTLEGITPTDLESLSSATIGGVSFLYLGDTGDNANNRATFVIYRCVEPVVTGSNGEIAAGSVETITCAFPAGDIPSHKDVETLLVDPATGDLYVLTKRFTPAKMYKLAHAASYSGTQTLEALGEIWTPALSDNAQNNGTGGYIVGGCIAPNGREILIKNYTDVFRIPRNPNAQTVYAAMQATGTRVAAYCGGANAATTDGRLMSHPNTEPQGEGICFDTAGRDFYTLSEFATTKGSGASAFPTFKYRRLPRAYIEVALQDGVDSYTGTADTYVQVSTPATGHGSDATFIADLDASDERFGLLKFDLSSIPAGATVVGCDLLVTISTEGQDFAIYKMLTAWTEASTYSTINGGNGISRDDVVAASVPDAAHGNYDTLTGRVRIKIPVATIQAWISGQAANNGWVFINTLASLDGLQFGSRDNASQGNRPRLDVRYTL